RPVDAQSPQRAGAEPAAVRAAGLAVAAPIAPSRRGTSVIDEGDGAESTESHRSWRLRPKWPSLLTGGSRTPTESRAPSEPRALRETRAPRVEVATPVAEPSVRRTMRIPAASEGRTPMFGRLRRELQIWYWRRGAGNALDKKPTRQ